MGVLRDNLQPTDFADAICRVSPWHPFPHHGYSQVRVWVCKCGHHWFQRHEWASEGANSTRIDDWIYSGFSTSRRMPEHMLTDGLQLIEESDR